MFEVANKKRQGSLLFILLIFSLVLAGCSVSPISPESMSEVIPESAPASHPSGSFSPDRFVVAPDGYCTSLFDIDIPHTSRVLGSLDFWVYFVNFKPAPAELLALHPNADYAGCALLHFRRDTVEQYMPFSLFLLTPCYDEGGTPVSVTQEPTLVPTTGLHDSNGGWNNAEQEALVATFTNDSHLRCEFNLAELEKTYLDLVRDNQTDLVSNIGLTRSDYEDLLKDHVDTLIGPEGEQSDATNGRVINYRYFSMAAAVQQIVVTNTNQITADGFSPPTGETLGELPVTHPLIKFTPRCDTGPIEYSTDIVLPNPNSDGSVVLARALGESLENNTPCPRGIDFGYTVGPESGGRVLLSSDLMGLTYYPDFENFRGGCERFFDCMFDPTTSTYGQYVLMEFGEAAEHERSDHCLDIQVDPVTGVATAFHPATQEEWKQYLDFRFKEIEIEDWDEWCTRYVAPTTEAISDAVLATAVHGRRQQPLNFWTGEADIIIGYNPDTGEYFDGSLYEAWVDPNTAVGN